VESRLELAKSVGATYVINTSNPDIDLSREVLAVTDGEGASITMDTTGVQKLFELGVEFTARRGKFFFVGLPGRQATLSVHVVSFISVSQGPVVFLESRERLTTLSTGRAFKAAVKAIRNQGR